MSAVSPRLTPDAAASGFANSSPSFSNVGQVQFLQALPRADIDQGLTKIATLMRGPTRIPTQAAAELAADWLYASCERATKLGGWRRPHISSTEAGEVVFEWWRGARNLTLYFSDDGAEYIQVWGPDMENEMISGPLNNWSFSNVWLWLQS
ncbi:hypothetical protein [Bradyrhizobium sp. 131]|uniref:hypothetical protein n=1 Tax=Bradyrhizobium sp. 131 TaxID=2782609 RepID=UPI001FFF08B1|nr:hypothetical protein [Bradyrhizobium sp. 131]UPK16090.1 hypothetical protein IVA73_18020 [Bradyrhizobium sp. 131]